MAVHSSDALVLRTYRYGEADCIVVFLTADRGKKRGVAKNAVKSRRRFGAALEPLTRGTATYVEREHRDLVRLDRIDPVTSPWGRGDSPGRPEGAASPAPGRADALGLSHLAYFAELLDEWAPEGQANERLFRLGAGVAQALREGGSADTLARYFEFWLLKLEGVHPGLDACELSPSAKAFLTAAVASTPQQAGAAPVPDAVLREIERVHQHLIATHLEKDLRSVRVLRELRYS